MTMEQAMVGAVYESASAAGEEVMASRNETTQEETDAFSVSFSTVGPAEVMVYEFGCRIAKGDLDHLRDQLWRSRRLFNEVAAQINQTVDEAKCFLSDRAGPVAGEIAVRLGVLDTEWKSAKALDDREALVKIAGERKSLRTRWYGLLHKARREHGTELRERYLSRIGNRVGAATYALRCAAVDDGLDWAMGNEALAAALGAFGKQWPRFKPISFRRFDDPTEVATLQFTAAGGVAVADILADKHSQIGMQLGREQAGRRMYVPFRMKLGSGAQKKAITGTVLYHRPLPAGASVPIARLVGRRIGKDVKHYLQFMVKLKQAEQPGANSKRAPMGVAHLGWYYQPTGRRLAEVASSEDPGLSEQLTLPIEVAELLDRARELDGQRSKLRDGIVGSVVRELPVEGAPEQIAEEVAALRKMRIEHVAPRRLGKLVFIWSRNCADWQRDRLKAMQAWRLEDRMLWQSSAHTARRARNRRRKHYEQLALSLAGKFTNILIDVPDLAQVAKVKDEDTGEHNGLGARARGGRFDAALYELTSAIEKAGARLGCNVGKIKGPTASTCAHCGGTTKMGKTVRDVVCEACGAVEDRAASAAAVAFGWASQNKDAVDEAVAAALDADRAKATRAAERKEKMAIARATSRAARTESDEDSADGSRELK